MTLTARRIAHHIILLMIIVVALSVVAIWLGLGPVVHSASTA